MEYIQPIARSSLTPNDDPPAADVVDVPGVGIIDVPEINLATVVPALAGPISPSGNTKDTESTDRDGGSAETNTESEAKDVHVDNQSSGGSTVAVPLPVETPLSDIAADEVNAMLPPPPSDSAQFDDSDVEVSSDANAQPSASPVPAYESGDDDIKPTPSVTVTDIDENSINFDDSNTSQALGSMAPRETPAREFSDQVDLLKMGNGIESEFERINQESKQKAQSLTTNIGSAQKNSYKNAEGAPLPYDHSIVELEGEDLYYNANLISGKQKGDRQYIAAQGPTEATFKDFWTMIWQEEVHVIVMVADDNEVYKYWTDKDESQPVSEVLDVMTTELFDYGKFLLRVLSLSDYETEESRWIYQIQHKDFNSFNVDGFKDLLKFIDHYESQSPGKTVLVHCVHGCGRTGTVIAADIMKNKLEANPDMDIDLPSLVKNLREERASLIASVDNYAFLYEYVASLTRDIHGQKEKESAPPTPEPQLLKSGDEDEGRKRSGSAVYKPTSKDVPHYYRDSITPMDKPIDVPDEFDERQAKRGPPRPPAPKRPPPPPSTVIRGVSSTRGPPKSPARSPALGSVSNTPSRQASVSGHGTVHFGDDAVEPLDPPILVKKRSFLQRMSHKIKKTAKYGNIPMIRPQKGEHKLEHKMKKAESQYMEPTLVSEWIDKLNSDEKAPTLTLSPPEAERKVAPSLDKSIGLISYEALKVDNWFARPKGPRSMPLQWFQGLPPTNEY
ncbi:hypothetical protein SARC_03143 [Sphaeroforma arctica JP610]|uniref:Tyrosine specific protein phosphatases domain-containing protein n=1 Tax=Sphaeroforma arctica JP610 TaxID=667725 RepID=A0A0L0G6L9_9EUKA|nr:hypothetical protein SARC_03143 [Sphaeroforma arctica JP610]KNC84652.1 hypothetical protein SARC_03143 [Sphaeroforma arctica JP610]|eukprot:XP_014158554.1 hypothetical protein SARC_03143 [Sphaeroforma arctica JP610]